MRYGANILPRVEKINFLKTEKKREIKYKMRYALLTYYYKLNLEIYYNNYKADLAIIAKVADLILL